jgi:S1-C subfamily serine protease
LSPAAERSDKNVNVILTYKAKTLIAGISIVIISLGVMSILFANLQVSLLPAYAEPLAIISNNTDINNAGMNVSHTSTFAEPLNLTAHELSYTQLFNHVKNSVVQVTTIVSPVFQSLLPPGSNSTEPMALGSGFIVDNEGHVVTNNHVVFGAQNVTVTFSDGSIYPAIVIGSDPLSDIAVLALEGNITGQKLTPLPLANSSALNVGEQVAAVGNPFGLTQSFTTGVISGLGRLLPEQLPPARNGTHFTQISPLIPNVIQTDALIDPGNSGGPLLDLKGEVVGMNTATVLAPPYSFSGIGLAIPSDTLRTIIPALVANGTFAHPWLGISGTDVTPEIAAKLHLKEARGFLIVDIVMDSPAYKAGLRGGDIPVNDIAGFGAGQSIRLGGDIVVKIDDKPVNKIDDLISFVESHKKVGDSVTLTILRDGKPLNIDLVLSKRPLQ